MTDYAPDKPELADLLEGETVIAEGVSYEDYLRQFENQRTEWVVGYVIERAMSNNVKHNSILGTLHILFSMFVALKFPGSKVLLAGISMYLGEKIPAREPDLIVVLPENTEHITYQNLNRRGDLVIEIVSPESKIRDREKKLKEYAAAGIPEYWLVDPLLAKAALYVLDDAGQYEIYPLTAEGKLQSKLLPGFVIEPTLLWRDDAPDATELVQLAQALAASAN
jgi:Uma2 family endonuclease